MHVGQQNRELVPAQTGDGVGDPQHTGQPRPDLAEQLIAVLVAEGVVDLLETVQVQQQQPNLCPSLSRTEQGRFQAIIEQRPVWQPGQLIVQRPVLHLLLQGEAISDIVGGQHEPFH